MKNKQIAILMGMALCVTAVTGCGTETKATSDTQQETSAESTEETSDTEDSEKTDNTEKEDPQQNKEDRIFGTVVSVSEDSITISVEAAPEGGQKPEEKEDSKSGASEETDSGEETFESETDAEEQTISITEDTIFRKQSMGQPGGGETPEKPDGEAPEKPDGEAPADGEAPEKPEGETPLDEKAPGEMEGEEIILDEIAEGDIVSITLDEDGNAASINLMSAEMGQPGGGQAEAPEEYEAAEEYTEDTETEGETYESDGTDENAVHVTESASVVLKDPKITRTSSDSTGGDASSFYGVGAALLADSGTAYVSGGTVDTDAAGAAGLFAYDGGTVYAADTAITTKQDTSGGIHAAGGGTLYAWDLDVTTEGESSAAIRSDRGGGTMVVDGGSYTSNGTGSPAVYCTADIAVNNAQLTANGSEAVCIEGLNSLHLYDCDLSGNMSDDSRNDCTWNVILYQSMSGDSEVGNSTFEMTGGSLKGENGGMFYTTNTESTITLSDVDITYPEDCDYFLKCTGNSNERGWGQQGENGADCLFTAISQEMKGDMVWDSISSLDAYLTDASSLKGAVVKDESNAEDGGSGYCNIYIDKDSVWTVTGDSTVSSLHCLGTIQDEAGNTVTVKGTDGTVYVEGNSDYAITTETYEDSADVSGASQTTVWTAYKPEKPAEL